MSNPPFGSPLNNEEDDFSFPFQPPNDEPIINYPPPIQDQNFLASTSSPLPMSDYHELSILLGDVNEQDYTLPMSDYHELSKLLGDVNEQDYTLVRQYNSNIHETINWASPIDEQVVIGDLDHDQVQQGGVQNYYPTTTTTIDDQAGGGGEGSSSKKLDHNAREKVRRMKLNETYMTLRSLLPDSKRAKKRWSAPYIIDRALDYIPQLQSEVEKLTLEKSSMLSLLENKKQLAVGSSSDDLNVINKDNKTLTVSMNEVKRGEVIIQLCEHNNKDRILSTLIEKLESEGLHILGASSQRVCEDRSCFHLHVQSYTRR
ncbi:hypothetical protein RDABS01_018163 [Bienertia sinuspersici]